MSDTCVDKKRRHNSIFYSYAEISSENWLNMADGFGSVDIEFIEFRTSNEKT